MQNIIFKYRINFYFIIINTNNILNKLFLNMKTKKLKKIIINLIYNK